jgi:hypothetical protein
MGMDDRSKVVLAGRMLLKNRTIYMRPEIVPKALDKGYSWEVKFAEFRLNPHAIFPAEI